MRDLDALRLRARFRLVEPGAGQRRAGRRFRRWTDRSGHATGASGRPLRRARAVAAADGRVDLVDRSPPGGALAAGRGPKQKPRDRRPIRRVG
ncbi:MAG: hypothetical protein DWQ37_18495 [Planctomycetota bacterium]|nr:MAG: hypothetical protein DWQ37_18495 [Planctomycetota bacterium]